jgi:hypothetical protein
MNKLIFSSIRNLKLLNSNFRLASSYKKCLYHENGIKASYNKGAFLTKKNSRNGILFYHVSAINLNDNAAQENEKKVGSSEKHEFLAETKQLLNIVAKSLYSEREVFIRELISNASDAIEKLKYDQLTNQSGLSVKDQEVPFEIQINADDITNTLTIYDRLLFSRIYCDFFS